MSSSAENFNYGEIEELLKKKVNDFDFPKQIIDLIGNNLLGPWTYPDFDSSGIFRLLSYDVAVSFASVWFNFIIGKNTSNFDIYLMFMSSAAEAVPFSLRFSLGYNAPTDIGLPSFTNIYNQVSQLPIPVNAGSELITIRAPRITGITLSESGRLNMHILRVSNEGSQNVKFLGYYFKKRVD